MVRTIVAVFVFAAAVHAVSNLECLAVSVVVNGLHATSEATSFCSSLLHLAPSTTTYITTTTSISISTVSGFTSTTTITNPSLPTSVSLLD
jgi:hypothetical protein